VRDRAAWLFGPASGTYGAMAEELGTRLVRAGLVTRAQLREALRRRPGHGGALTEALVALGVDENALAGFFIANGYGPLMEARDLTSADVAATSRLDADMACALLALPIRSSPGGLVVAMADPSDQHAVAEIAYAVGTEVLPTVARLSELQSAIESTWPEAHHRRARAGRGLSPDSSATPIDLVRRRSPPVPETKTRARDEDLVAGPYDAAAPGSRPAHAIDPEALGLSEDRTAALPLVRPKKGSSEPAGRRGLRDTGSYGRPDRLRRRTGDYERAPVAQASVIAVGDVEEPGRVAQEAPVEQAPEAEVPTSDATHVDPGDRWSELLARPASPAGKLSPSNRRALSRPRGRRRSLDIGDKLAAMRATQDRDDVMRLACEAAATVGRVAVFLALRKGILTGRDAVGSSLSPRAARNLWIPTGSPSVFRDVIETREPYFGPYGAHAADTVFKAACGNRGGKLLVQPVTLGGRVAALLCVDGVADGAAARERLEELGRAVGEAFRRIILSTKAT
jgi:hypothetical protein